MSWSLYWICPHTVFCYHFAGFIRRKYKIKRSTQCQLGTLSRETSLSSSLTHKRVRVKGGYTRHPSIYARIVNGTIESSHLQRLDMTETFCNTLKSRTINTSCKTVDTDQKNIKSLSEAWCLFMYSTRHRRPHKNVASFHHRIPKFTEKRELSDQRRVK